MPERLLIAYALIALSLFALLFGLQRWRRAIRRQRARDRGMKNWQTL